jgi:hypothetical protein
MIDSHQEALLIGGGECPLHTHPEDIMNFDDHIDQMDSDPIIEVSSDYIPTDTDFRIRVDTTAGDVIITMPVAANGREYQIMKRFNANRLFIIPTAPDTIIGSETGVIVYNAFTSLHLKAVFGEGWDFV